MAFIVVVVVAVVVVVVIEALTLTLSLFRIWCKKKKPHNVLINVNCEARICDFGLARSFDFENIDSPVMSTYYLATRWYRAPEMLIESTVATMVSDVWSCGCILFELLSRDVLFKGKNRVHQLEGM